MKIYAATLGSKEIGWSRHNEEGVHRDYQLEAERLANSANNFGIETIIYQNEFMFQPEFYPKYKEVLDKVSFGFAFKSMITYDMLTRINSGDVLIFADSNHIIAQNPQPLIDMALKNNIFVRDHIWVKYPNRDWTRRDTFVNMGCDMQKFWDSLQMQANVTIYAKNDFTLMFTKMWRDFCLDYHINFGDQKYKNFPSFITHRYDQSVFSILVEKYHIPYLNRTENVWNEYIIPEISGIEPTPDRLVDNSYRRDIDKEYNR